MESEGGWNNFEDWAKVSCDDVEDEQGSSSSSSAEVVVDKSSARFMVRRDSSDSVEVMSMENDEDDDGADVLDETKTAINEIDLLNKSSSSLSKLMSCSTCSNMVMNQSLTSSMVHVKMEEIETQTDDIVKSEAKDCGTDPMVKSTMSMICEEEEESQLEKTLDVIAAYIHRHGHQLIFIPSHLLFAMLVLSTAYMTGVVRIDALSPSPVSETSALEDSLVSPLMPSVLAPSLGSLAKSTVTTTLESSDASAQQQQQPIQELQSPEWLDRLSTLLDDVSNELLAVDTQISAVERQLEQFDQQQLPSAKQLFVIESYRQLVEKQRQAGHVLDKVNSVLNVDRQSRREPPTMLDVRLKLVDVAGDFVTLNSRMTEVTLANKRRHINIAKRAVAEKHRIEAAYLSNLVERIRSSAGESVDFVDSRSAACRRLYQPTSNVPSHLDVVECLTRSRAFAVEVSRQMNATVESERRESIRQRQRAMVAERAVVELREEINDLHNTTVFLQKQQLELLQMRQKQQQQLQLRQQQQLQQRPKSFVQCLASMAPSASSSPLAELLRRPEHCDTCELIEGVGEQFASLLSRLSSSLLDGSAKELSIQRVLIMLHSTFASVTTSTLKWTEVPKPSIPPVLTTTTTTSVVSSGSSNKPLLSVASSSSSQSNMSIYKNSTWTMRLGMKLGSVRKTLTRAVKKLYPQSFFKALLESRNMSAEWFMGKKAGVTLMAPPVTRHDDQCRRLEGDYERVHGRVVALQSTGQFWSAAVLNELSGELTRLSEHARFRQCLGMSRRHFVECQLAWIQRIRQLSRSPASCAEPLPASCQLQPWQRNFAARLESMSLFMEALRNHTVSKQTQETARQDQGPPAPRVRRLLGKKGDDGSVEVWQLPQKSPMGFDSQSTVVIVSSSKKTGLMVLNSSELCSADAVTGLGLRQGPRVPRMAPSPFVRMATELNREDERVCTRDLAVFQSLSSTFDRMPA